MCLNFGIKINENILHLQANQNPMNLNQNTDYQNKILLALEKSSDEQAIAMLLELRESGGIFILPYLFNILISKKNEQLKKTVIEFITDIKDKEATTHFIQFLKSNFPQKDVTDIVTACWQSRLDFSEHIDIFFEILCSADYQTAFEAFTVIENNIDGFSVSQLDELIKRVKVHITKSNRDKQLLLLEMVSILEKAKRTAS